MQDNINPQDIQASVNAADLEDLLRQLIDKNFELDKEKEVIEKKLDEKTRTLAMLKTSNQWLMHEVAALEREKSQYTNSI